MTKLKRSLTLPHMVLYGLGTTIGAGIYALLGEVAARSGYMAPLAFLAAALLAATTALAFAELCGRYPRAAGAALYVQQGFHSSGLSRLVGLLVALAGLVSSAALLNAFSGYLTQLVHLPVALTLTLLVSAIVLLALWGIVQSVYVAGLLTLIEVGGLVWIILITAPNLAQLPLMAPLFMPDASLHSAFLVVSGVLLAFYAFIGFENMVDVAEEVKQVRRTLPRAILVTLFITAALYFSLMLLALLTVPLETLAGSAAPLALIYETQTGQAPTVITLIGLLALLNGALIQTIMASRVLYGLGSRQLLPSFFGQVSALTRTPVKATLVAGLLVLLFAVSGNLASLAQTTSLIMLSVFALVNLALWNLKGRINKHPPAPEDNFQIPRWIPLLGFLSSLALILYELYATLQG